MIVDEKELAPLLPDFLVRQRWFAGLSAEGAAIAALEVLDEGPPSLLWLLVEHGDATYQMVVGLRPLEGGDRFLEGKGLWLLGDVDSDQGPLLAYDALIDPELAVKVLHLAAPGEEAGHSRLMAAEQSNSSVVFDERVILKLFRKVEVGRNADVELCDVLTEIGFPHIPATRGDWVRDGRDLATVRQFLVGGGDGWQLALTSLRDVISCREEPCDAGGDIAPEAERLGRVTAELHVALARALGSRPAAGAEWVDQLGGQRHGPVTSRADADPAVAAGLAAFDRILDDLRGVADAGAAMRVHGDLHLGQVLRTDAGWFLLDFEGEPAVSMSDRRRLSSPLRDVAGMLRSFSYATAVAISEQGDGVDDHVRGLAERWEARAGGAFLEGYASVDGVAELLPASEADRRAVLDAFLAGKAVYEVGYELAHRPDWVGIPLAALARLAGVAR